VAFLRAMAEAAGLRVHVFTSPHLVRFAERIRLAGTLITDEALTAVLEEVETANAGQPITFFEITTVAALTAFASVPADLCIIEVGLGGRFDSTNVIPTPKVAVIAPVDLDHKEFLGEDLAGIATEKAGILKSGGKAVVARQRDAAREAIEAAADQARSDIGWMGQNFDAFAQAGRMVWQDDQRLLDLPLPALTGAHQIDNAGLAIAAALALGDPRITEEAISEGLRRVTWPARLQRLTAGPLAALAEARGADLWLDGGHNPHAAAALSEAAQAMTARDGRPLTLIVGLLANKDAAGVLAPFKGLEARLIFTGFEAEAAASTEILAEVAKGLGMPCEMAPDVSTAMAAAVGADGPSPHILIFGSLYLAGEVLALSADTWPT
jgi:dihydrofolate synthase/folylpolyglutamate synthase